ncbi:MAG: NTP transferase domain-containing protein [Chloroflexi bacterium]|nr:NTP transferase domain-containing protein [Chloroflexota bacterium]
MKVVIPLAGFGTRLRPHTFTKPKPLVSVAGKPVLGHILDKLKGVDISEIIYIVGYLGNQIEEYVEANYQFPSRYVVQEELKGQAHAIWLAREHIEGPVLIIFVDTIFETDLSALRDEPSDGIVYVSEVDDPGRFGVVIVGQDGYIQRLVEKPTKPVSNLAVIGLYYLKDSALLMECIDELIRRDIKTQGEYFLADALQLMIDRGQRLVARTVEVWEDCGKPETVLHTNRYLLEHGGAQEVPTDHGILIPPVYVDKTAVIRESIIGPYVSVAAGAVIVRSIIRNSIINENAHIENAVLTDSLIGKDADVRGSFERLNVGDSSQVSFAGGGDSK